MSKKFVLSLTDIWLDIGDFESPSKVPGSDLEAQFGDISEPKLVKKVDTLLTPYILKRDNAVFMQDVHPFSPYSELPPGTGRSYLSQIEKPEDMEKGRSERSFGYCQKCERLWPLQTMLYLKTCGHLICYGCLDRLTDKNQKYSDHSCLTCRDKFIISSDKGRV